MYWMLSFDRQGWKEPRCVDMCPTQAIRFGEEIDLSELINKAKVMSPGSKTRLVYFI